LICGTEPIDYITVRTDGGAPGQSDLQLTAYYYPETLRLADLPLGGDDLSRTMCAYYTYVAAAQP
jgi:hypothetical protein